MELHQAEGASGGVQLVYVLLKVVSGGVRCCQVASGGARWYQVSGDHLGDYGEPPALSLQPGLALGDGQVGGVRRLGQHHLQAGAPGAGGLLCR